MTRGARQSGRSRLTRDDEGFGEDMARIEASHRGSWRPVPDFKGWFGEEGSRWPREGTVSSNVVGTFYLCQWGGY
jgi:hypothetical protein